MGSTCSVNMPATTHLLSIYLLSQSEEERAQSRDNAAARWSDWVVVCKRSKGTEREISRDKDWDSHFLGNSAERRICFTCHFEGFSKYTIFNPKPHLLSHPTKCCRINEAKYPPDLFCPGLVPANVWAGPHHEIWAGKRHCD